MAHEQTVFGQCAFIADLAAARGLIDLKQAALLFDSIHVLKTPEGGYDPQVRDHPFSGVSIDDLEWLSARGLWYNLDDPSALYRQQQICEFLLLGSAREERVKQLSNIVPRYYAGVFPDGAGQQRAIPLVFGSNFRDVRLLDSKIDKSFQSIPEEAYGLATAIVMSYVPVPDPLTPWEAILDFRQEASNKRGFANLRSYISAQSRSSKSPADLRDEIESDFLNLKASLERCRIKYRTKMMETTVVSAASIVENILKVRFSEFVKPFFTIARTRQEYTEDEARLAERSLYYVVKAQETFGASCSL